MLTRSSYTQPFPVKDYGNLGAQSNGVAHNNVANNQQMAANPAVDNSNVTTATATRVASTHANQSAV